ncbi:MAG TPA: glycosyltransferase, partial [Parasegetibacter sp.]
MVSVIIPALNEEETIANVVSFCLSQNDVSEVIVVDDKSVDNTVAAALEAGAKVITSTRLGKGISMKDGMLFASNDILVFLDGDIFPYPEDTISKLTRPILENEYDFVKATFSRNAGRVTELVAKPLLSIFYPELSVFSQPLSGMIAGRKSLFEKVDFLSDYGVDIGILIDMFLQKARITEVNIGYIENKSKPWQELGKMSKEVARAIITKAMAVRRETVTLEELESMTVIKDQMEFALREQVVGLKKMVVFDMDNTLLRGRFIDTAAATFGFDPYLKQLRASETDPVI